MTADEVIVNFSLGEIKNHKWHLQVPFLTRSYARLWRARASARVSTG